MTPQAGAIDDVTPIPASSIKLWDHEVDVVIAGCGVAGAAAAVAAATAGADVLVLERMGSWGGAASMAGGFIYLGGGTALQKACGFDDSVENMIAFLNVAMGPGADESRIADYCEGSVAHFEWLVACNVPFKAEFFGEPGWEPMGDQGLMYSGGENSYPFDTIATPAPLGHVPQMSNKKQGEHSAGFMLMKPLVETATAAGAKALYDSRVQRPIVESDSRVVGVAGRQYGTDLTIRARRGVVLATGSFAYNDAMVAQYAPRIVGRPAASIEQHDGRSIRMAQALGADLAHMDATEVAIFIDPQQLVRGILVNGRGQRYVAEDTNPGRVGQLTLYHQDNTAYLILDDEAQQAAHASQTSKLMLRPATWVAETGRRAGARDGAGARRASSDGRGVQRRRRARRGCAAAQKAGVAAAARLPYRGDRSTRQHWRLHSRGTGDNAGRRSPACQRKPDSRAVRRRPQHGRARRVGLCQRHLSGRRQLLRPPGRTVRREGLSFRR